MSRRRKGRATDSNVITVSMFNGSNSLFLFALGVALGWFARGFMSALE